MLGSVLSESSIRSIREWRSAIMRRHPIFWISIGLGLLYVYLIVFPFLSVAYASFTAHGSSFTGPFQFENWYQTIGTVRPVLVNTILYSVGTAVTTTVIGVALAWSIARTNVPWAKGFYFLAFIGFFFPPVAWEISWLRLLGRNGVYASLLGLETLGVGSIPGMILVASIRFVPLGLVLLVPLFASIDKSMEDAGLIAGGGTLRITWDITVKLIAPGILAVGLLVLLISLGSFRVPLLIGKAHGIEVLSVTIYEAVSIDPQSYGVAMTQSIILVGIALPMLYLYKRSLGATKKYATISGQGYERSPIDIGRWRYVVFAGLAAFFLLAILAPVLLLIYTSFMPYYIPPHSLQSFELFTLQSYQVVLSDSRILGAIRNSFVVAFLGTALLIAGSILTSWIVHKTDVRFRDLIDYLSFSVIGLPSIPLAVGLIYVYLLYVPKGDIIYNSFAILIIAMYTRFISATVKVIEPGVIQIKQELLEAGELAGDTVYGRLRNIVLPLIKGNAQAAWAMRFSIIFMEFPIAVMLQTRETEMVAAALLTMQTQAQFPHIAAFGVSIMVILGAMTLAIHRF